MIRTTLRIMTELEEKCGNNMNFLDYLEFGIAFLAVLGFWLGVIVFLTWVF